MVSTLEMENVMMETTTRKSATAMVAIVRNSTNSTNNTQIALLNIHLMLEMVIVMVETTILLNLVMTEVTVFKHRLATRSE